MEALEALEIIGRGEDGRHQFKRLFNNEKQAAAEMVALSNSDGGQILIGVEDNGTITGLTPEEVDRHNQLISNAAAQHVRNSINPPRTAARILDKNLVDLFMSGYFTPV